MTSESTTLRARSSRALRRILPWALALAAATCTDDQNGPSQGGRGYFAFKPVYGISGSLSDFGVYADNVHILLTRPVNEVVLDTTVVFPADSSSLHLALPVQLDQSPESLSAVIEVKSGSTILFVDSLAVQVFNGPPSATPPPTVVLDYVGPGKNIGSISITPGDTTVRLRDTVFFSATAKDSSNNPVAPFFSAWKTSDTNFAKINAAGRLIAPNARGSVQVIGYTPTGIADTTNVIFAPFPVVIAIDSGAGQSGLAGDSLATEFVARVKASDSLPVEGIAVKLKAVTALGAIRDTLLFTDVNGRVRTRGVLGTASGSYSYTATIVGTALTANVTATALAGPAAAIAIQSGNAQTDSTGRTLGQPLTVRVADAFNNPVTGAKVYWTRVVGTGTRSADSTFTNASGLASITYTLGTVGLDSINAALAGTSAFVSFSATTVNGAPATIVTIQGDSQTVGPNTTLDTFAVRVRDAGNHPVIGAKVDWSFIPALGNFFPILPAGGLSSFTDSLGVARGIYQSTTAATTVRVEASIGGHIDSLYVFIVPAAPTQILVFSGQAQFDTAGQTLAPFVVQVKDSVGNKVAGVSVRWDRISGSGTPAIDTSVTDTAGLASFTYTLGSTAGADTVEATILGTGTAVEFTATTLTAAPVAIQKVLGDSQADTVLSTLTDSLIVKLVDGGNNPVPNTWLYWLTAGAHLSADSTLTDANGRAAVQVTLDSFAIPAFPVLVRNVDTTLATSFFLRAKHGKPTQISKLGGDGQSGQIGTPLPIQLSVLAQDKYGNLADSTAVLFTRTFGSGSFNSADSATDSLGIAFAGYTLGNSIGTDTILAMLANSADTVVFTETAGSGAPSSLVYVSGTGQGDTVNSTLASPFTVQVRDAGSNPVSGVWVHFTRITGNGVAIPDSALTDGSGSAASTYTLGTAVGIDSVLATVTGLSDTVPFYAVTGAGAPALFTMVTGDSQAASVSSVLAQPFAVRVMDQFSNPIAGVSVAFDTTATGGIVAGSPTTTNVAGVATSGTITLGANAGTYGFLATTSAIPADTIHFTAIATPIGTSKTWTGALSSTWGAAGNWSPSGIPSSSDNVFVPITGNAPVLDASRTIGGLQIDPAVTINLGAFNLTMNGNVSGGGALGGTSGVAILAAGSGTVTGHFRALKVTGSMTMTGPVDVLDSLVMTSGALVLGGNRLDVGGILASSGGAALTMTNAADTADIGGNASWNGSTSGSLLTAGTLILRGNLSAPSLSATFQGTGSHTTVFAGASAQSISFPNNNGSGGNRFQNVVFANTAGVALGTGTYASGNVTDSTGTAVTGNVTIGIGGTLAAPQATDWQVHTTTFAGSPTAFPDSLMGDVGFTGATTLTQDIVIKGAVTMTSGSFTLAGFTARFDSTLTTSGGAQLKMQNATDSLDIGGAASLNGNTAGGLLTAGTLVARGNFTAPSLSATFQASGSHRTVFAGTSAQNVSFPNNNGAGGNRFFHLTIANAAGVNFGTGAYATGDLDVLSGALATTSAGVTVGVGGNMTDADGAGWQGETVQFTGTPTTLPDSIAKNASFNGSTVTLAKALLVKGTAFFNSAGSFTLNGHRFEVDSTLTINGGHQVKMQNALDTLIAGDSVNWNGNTAGGLLTAGTLIVRGSFLAPSLSATFQAGGTHTTVFAGTVPQFIYFPNNQGTGGNRFQNLVFNNAAGVTFATGATAMGNADLETGVVTSTGGASVAVGGSLTDTSNVNWQPALTILSGVPATLPDSFAKSVSVTDTVILTKDLVVHGAFAGSGSGVFNMNGHALRVDSTLSLTGGIKFLMQNAADSLDVGQGITWNGSTVGGLLTAGTLVARGGLVAPSLSATFQPSGTHRAVIAALSAQTVGFPNNSSAGGNHFNTLEFTDGSAALFSSDIFVTGMLVKPTTTLPAFVTGTNRLLQVRGLSVDGMIFDSVRVASSGPATTLFKAVKFLRQDPTLNQLTLVEPGTAAPVTFDDIQFTTTTTSGHYVSAKDTVADGKSLHIRFTNSVPLDGSTHELQVASSDTVQLDWSHLAFVTQPTDVGAGAFLAPIQVAVISPLGDTVVLFNNSILLTMGANPGNGSLNGVVSKNATAGVATFDSVSVDSAGAGYTLNANAGGLGTVSSLPFNVTIPIPSGFNAVWVGNNNNDWTDSTNWSTLRIPDSTDNVFIPSVATNQPFIANDVPAINRLQVAVGANLAIGNVAHLPIDSSLQSFGSITGTGGVDLHGNGFVTGFVSSSAQVTGQYNVLGHASFGFNLQVSGDLTVDADTLQVSGLLQTVGSGTITQKDPASSIDVTGPVQFQGGSTTGKLTNGELIIRGDFQSGGGAADAFAPSGAHWTRFLGTAHPVSVNMVLADTLLGEGSHFNRVEFQNADTVALFSSKVVVADSMSITDGVVIVGQNWQVGGVLSSTSASTLAATNLLLGSSINAQGAYQVGTTTFYGGGSYGIPSLTYDTLMIERSAHTTGDLFINGDLRIDGGGSNPASFDINQFHVTVGNDFRVDGNAQFSMLDTLSHLTVGHDFTAAGNSTYGLLTHGVIDINNSFIQSAIVSAGSFRADPGLKVNFLNPITRAIIFASPANPALPDSASRFGDLDVTDGTTNLGSSVVAAGDVRVGAAVVEATPGSGYLFTLGKLSIDSANGLLRVHVAGFFQAPDVPNPSNYQVARSVFGGAGLTIPTLPYDTLQVFSGSDTAAAGLSVGGPLLISDSTAALPAVLVPNGNHILVNGTTLITGQGRLRMAAGDTVDLAGGAFVNGGNSAGFLTGGLVRTGADFAVGTLNSDSTWLSFGTNLEFANNSSAQWILDGRGTLGAFNFGNVTVSAGGGLDLQADSLDGFVVDTLALTGGSIVAPNAIVQAFGPVTAAATRTLNLGTLEVHDSLVVDPSYYSVSLTRFAGTGGQGIPVLPYINVDVVGDAVLGGNLSLPSGGKFAIGNSAVPSSDLALAGHVLDVDTFQVFGNGALTMAQAADTLITREYALFNGRDETGHLTAGVHLSRGDFVQLNSHSDSSFVATGTFSTEFEGTRESTDHVSFVTGVSGASRFRTIHIRGDQLVFDSSAWVTDSVIPHTPGTQTGGNNVSVTIGMALVDSSLLWAVDTTIFPNKNPEFPSFMHRNVVFNSAITFPHPFSSGGALTAYDTLDPNGFTIALGSNIQILGNGLLRMDDSLSYVAAPGYGVFDGATATGWMTKGAVQVDGDLYVGPTNNFSFDATGTRTILGRAGPGHVVAFQGAPHGAFADLDYADGLVLLGDILVRGDLTGSGEVPGNLVGVDSSLTILGTVQQQVTFNNVRVIIPEGRPLFDVSFTNMDTTRTQLTVIGAGAAAPVDENVIRFSTLPTTGLLVQAIDTLADGDSLVLRMNGSTPIQPTAYGSGVGEAAVRWPKMIFSAVPTTIDSLVPSTVQLTVLNPDGTAGNGGGTLVDLSLAVNPGNDTLNGSLTQTFWSSADWNDLVLTHTATGVRFFAAVQGHPTDTLTSAAFDVVNPAPVGAIVWDGQAGDGEWNSGLNWSTDVVPTAVDSVFIPSNQSVALPNGVNDTVGTLVIGTGASLNIPSGDSLVVFGRIQNQGTIQNGGGVVNLAGTGTISGGGQAWDYQVSGNYNVQGLVNVLVLDIKGVLGLDGADTMTVLAGFTTSDSGVLRMTHPDAFVDVQATANFNGGYDTLLTDGVLRVAGSFSAGGPNYWGFAPSGNHLTVLNGVGGQNIVFDIAPPGPPAEFQGPIPVWPLPASHFNRLQVNTQGTAQFYGNYGALADVTIGTGATFTDGGNGYSFITHGNFLVQSGASATLSSLAVGGVPDKAGTGLYSVGTTYLFTGTGAVDTLSMLPFDTLVLERPSLVPTGYTVQGDLRLDGIFEPVTLDLAGADLTVHGSVSVGSGTTVLMSDAAEHFVVDHDFDHHGSNPFGTLTAGTLTIGGNFTRSGGGEFQASSAFVTRFTGGTGVRTIFLGNGAFEPSDTIRSRFGRVELADGTDSIVHSLVADSISIGATVIGDTSNFGAGSISAFGPLEVLATSPGIQLPVLETWDTVDVASGPVYAVGQHIFHGGSTLPVLPYQSVWINGTDTTNVALTAAGDITIAGTLSIGQADEVGGSMGDLAVGGHTLTIGSGLFINGYGTFTMGAGDSVDVTGSTSFNGGNTSGHLTGGVLVARGDFGASSHSGDSTFVAGPAHHVVLLSQNPATLYATAQSVDGMTFGHLTVMDSTVRNVSGFSGGFVVRDTLFIAGAGTGLNAVYPTVHVEGALFTVAGSTLSLGNLVVDSSLQVLGGFTVNTTTFGGTAQPIPVLPYQNVTVTGTAFLTDSLIIPGYSLAVAGGAGAADLNLNGHLARASFFSASGQGKLTMQSAADSLLVSTGATFDGGNETGELMAGVVSVMGSFTQGNSTSDSSYATGGTHLTEFADTVSVMPVSVASMIAGASRFNQVAFGGHGVNFSGVTWIQGDVTLTSPSLDSIGGVWIYLGGSLTDTYHRWLADTTEFIGVNPVLPDSIDGTVVMSGADTLESALRTGGDFWIYGSEFVNNSSLVVGGSFITDGTGTIEMNSSSDNVAVYDSVIFRGGDETGKLTSGQIVVHGPGFFTNGDPLAFDASGTHTVDMAGDSAVGQIIGAFPSGQTNGFANLQLHGNSLGLEGAVRVHSNVYEGAGPPMYISGNDSIFTAGNVYLDDVHFSGVQLVTGDQSTLTNVSFGMNSPVGTTALTIQGPGRPSFLDLTNLSFADTVTGATFVAAIDTLADADSLRIRMFGSLPFNGASRTAITGDASVAWSHLDLATPLGLTVDSAVGFGLTLDVVEPDGQFRSDVQGSVDVSLVNGGALTLNGTTSANFDGSSASFFGLSIDGVATGLQLHFAMAGDPFDSLTSAPFDVINPMPAGSIVFDGGASDGLWSSAANWSGDVAPAATDSVFIPGGVSVTFDAGADTIGTLVLGSGAHLDLGGGTLTSTGNVAAGHTISGAGTLELASPFGQISGNLPEIKVTGSISAVGPTSIVGDLTIDGSGAEFNVGGQKVDVSGNLRTQNGGIFTMDGAADTLYINSATFSGGDETGHLTDGVLIIQGGGIDQGFGDPNSFHASGAHLTLFANGGTSTAVNIGDPQASQFGRVSVQNPDGVDFDESGLGYVKIAGDLSLSAGGVASGNTLEVGGGVTTTSGTTLTLDTLKIDTTASLGGTYDVMNTVTQGAPFTLSAAPAGYPLLTVTNAITLGDSVTVGQLLISGGFVDPDGHLLHTNFLKTNGSGYLRMTAAEDTVLADSSAIFNGGNETNHLTDGLLVASGRFIDTAGTFHASGDHVTRFTGGVTHLVTVSPYCEGNCSGFTPPSFGDLEIIGDSVKVNDPNGSGFATDSILAVTAGGTLVSSGIFAAPVRANGDVMIDATGRVDLNDLVIGGRLNYLGTDSTQYRVHSTIYLGADSVVAAPYNWLYFEGNNPLGANVSATKVVVDAFGRVTLAGHTLYASTSFQVTDSAHLEMHDDADSLWVDGEAVFEGPNSTGDLTAGMIRARSLVQQTGPSGDATSFVQTGSAFVQPLAKDTIRMEPNGPAGSVIRLLDLSQATDTVVIGNIWVSDTLRATNPATTVVTYSGADNLAVMRSAELSAGVIHLDTLAVGGTLDDDTVATTYQVFLTKFVGDSQAIPTGLQYNNLEVYYRAYLVRNLFSYGADVRVLNSGDLDLNGHTLYVRTFRTLGPGILTMTAPAESLSAQMVRFDGGNTTGHLTAGTILTGDFYQTNAYNDSSYAPSGTHALDLYDFGGLSETGPGIHSATGWFNILRIYATGTGINDKPKLWNGITVRDTFAVLGKLDDPFYAVGALGAVVFGPAAEVTIPQLYVGDTLDVNGSASYNIGLFDFLPGAAPLPTTLNYQDVTIEGAQTLTGPLTIGTDLKITGGGVLTANKHKVDVGTDLTVLDSAHLVMHDAEDTVQFFSATFNGASSVGDLTAGLIRFAGPITQMNSTSDSSFRPANNMEAFGFGNRFPTFASPGINGSYFHNLRLVDTSWVTFNTTDAAILGDVILDDGSYIVTGMDNQTNVDFYGKVTALTNYGGLRNTNYGLTTFHDSLFVDTLGFEFNIINTAFKGTSGIPDVHYQYLYLEDGVFDTLTHDLHVQYALATSASADSAMGLVLNGHTVNAGLLNTQQFGTFTMHNSLDSMIVAQGATFDGGDMTGRLTTGNLVIGEDLTQDTTRSLNSFRTEGTIIHFPGEGINHYLQFAASSQTTSFLGYTSLEDGGGLYVTSALTWAGDLNLNGGSFVASTLTNTQPVDFIGQVTIGDGGSMVHTGNGALRFYNDLLGGLGVTYNVAYTEFTQTNTLPDLPYQSLKLNGGTHDTLTFNPTITGDLTLSAATPDDQDFVLNGRTVAVGGSFSTDQYGRLTMADPNDTLAITGSALFNGDSLSGRLTAGLISIGQGFAQTDSTSDKSFRSTGTKVRFPFVPGVHTVRFATPDSSWFGDVDAGSPGGLLQLALQSDMKAGYVADAATVISAPGFHVTADSIKSLLGTFNVFANEVTTQRMSANGPTFYNVPTTTYVGHGVVAPFSYGTLNLMGADSITAGAVSAQNLDVGGQVYLYAGNSLTVNGNAGVDSVGATFTNDGGTFTVTGLLVTANQGFLISTNSGSQFTAGTMAFNADVPSSTLTAGTLTIKGSLDLQAAITTFAPDSMFEFKFNGGGAHVLTAVDQWVLPIVTVEATGTDSDTLSVIGPNSLLAYKLKANGGARLLGDGNVSIQAETGEVDNIIVDDVPIVFATTSEQPIQFDNVTFTGFHTWQTQLHVGHPGASILNPFTFNNVDFDDAAAPDGVTGFFVQLDDTDGITSFLHVNIYGPDDSAGPSLSDLLNGAIISWFPPS